jgi:hypothetical protein
MRTFFLLILAGLLCVPVLWAYEQPESECVSGNCQSGQGQLQYEDGATYKGGFEEGRRSGQGVYTHPGGIRYEGAFENGFMHGEGVLTSKDGRVYRGRFEEGAFHGEGTYSWPDGAIYEGTFYEGDFHEGKLHYPDGTSRVFTPEGDSEG